MRRGSALLIVLGMLSFMLFSGLAFSVYMRQTRLPSSFLRRTTVTRQLSKAALAMAIKEIDAKIGNDLHPNVTFKNNDEVTEESTSKTYDVWRDRVFCLPASESTALNRGEDPQRYDSYLVDQATTVPVLTLEGVAYLPPSLINEARYYFRRTSTATWHRFVFDAGRYAYAALDVSDYFDVNKMIANAPRASADARRLSLAHVFENDAHATGPANGPELWDQMLENKNVRTVSDEGNITLKMPLVSLADLNLAMGSTTYGSYIKSPFVQYLVSGNGMAGYYPGISDSDTDPQTEAYRGMTFVTDSLNVQDSSTTANNDLSLDSGDGQPFKKEELEKDSQPLYPLLNHAATLGFGKVCGTGNGAFLCRFGACQLYDYLDKNSVPVSLAIPTVEKTPMICGAQLVANNAKFTVSREYDPQDDTTSDGYSKIVSQNQNGGTRTIERTAKYYLKSTGLDAIQANFLTLYPFRNVDTPGTFNIDGAVGFFLAEKGNDKSFGLRYGSYAAGNPLLARTLLENDNSGILNNCVVKAKVNRMGCSIATPNPKTSEEAVTQQNCGSESTRIAAALNDPVLTVTYRWEQSQTVNPQTGQKTPWDPANPPANATVTAATYGIKPLGTNGSALNPENDKVMSEGVSVDLMLAVWGRITDTNSKVVDLAPATMLDDQLNGVDNAMCAMLDRDMTGEGVPVLKFSTGVNVTLSVSWLDQNNGKDLTVTLAPSALMVRDPRFNHDSRSWQAMNGSFDKTGWATLANPGATGCDGDVFMATSDQAYLQSPYELAHLLRLTNPFGDAGNFGDDTRGNLANSWAYNDFQTDKALNDNFFWKTYSPYAINGRSADDFEGIELKTGTSGNRVNPYSDSEEVMMAAFANTPLDWHHASTNDDTNAEAYDLDVKDFNTKYAWCQYAESGHKLTWDTLCNVADAFKSKVRSANDWETAFDNLGWSTLETDRIVAGVDMAGGDDAVITSADRKFLYGFWRGCFAARQQLFLVFVRAEPMMMGGGAVGMAPPQLGSRAVALVWRDPRATTANVPHPTRVLFYHPLD